MGDPDKIKQLYSTVSKDYDVGTYDDFSAKLQDSAKRKSFYEFASKNYDLGDYASFEGKVVKKKVGTSVSPAGSSGTTQPISAQKEADIRSYLSATPEQKNANAKGTVITDKPITAVKEKHLPSPKEVETEAVRRLTSPLATMQKIKKQDQIPGMNMGDDFLGDELGKLEKEKNNIVSGKITDPQSVGDRTVNEEIAIKEKQGQILKDNAFQTGKDAGNYLQYLENKNQKENSVDLNQLPVEEVAKRLPNTITAKSAFSKYQDRRKVTDALSGTENLIDAAFNYAGVKDLKNVSDAKKGYLVDQFLNNKDVQELVQENPQLYGKYKEAQINAMTQFPSYAMKSINQKVGQYIQDTDKDVWDSLGKNIKDEKLSEVVDEMVAKGELNEMEKSFFIKNKENAKSWLEYADPKIDQSLNRSAGEGWRGWEKSVRSIGNKLGLTDAGLLEPIENTDKRMEEIEYSTPNIQPKGTFGKAKKGISEFTGQMLPMMLTAGLMRGAGSGATAAEVFPVIMQFGGENERKAREHFKDDKLSQIQYTIAQTSIDAMLGRLLPHGKIANNLRTELRKDVVTAIEQLSAGNIEKAAVKENLIGAIGDKLKDIAKHNVKTANIVTGFQIAHNGIDAAFGKRDFKLEDEARDAFDTWKHSFVSATALSALASKTGYAQRGRDRQAAKDFIYDLAKNPEQAAAKIKEQAELNPEAVKDVEKRIENVQYGAKVLEELGRETEMNEQQKKNYLLNSLNEKVLREKAEATVDPTLKKKLDEQVKKAEIIKEEIINGKDVESLPQDDGLSAKEYKEVAEIKNDQELFDYFVKKSTKGYASTLNAALEMENKDEGRREGLKYMEDKAIENPKKFREDFGDALTEKMLDRVETKRLEESLDNLLDINADDPSIPILDKLIEKRHAKENKSESGISVIRPGEIKQPTETITIKPKEDAVQKQSADAVDVQPKTTDGERVGEGNARPEVIAEESKGKSEEEMTGITHAQMNEIAKEFGFPEYEKSPEGFKEWDAEATKRLSQPGAIDKLMNKMRDEGMPSPVEQRMMLHYVADLRAKVRKNPTPENLKELNRAKDISNIVGGRFVAQSLVARKGQKPTEETLDSFLSEWSEAHGVETLPQETIDTLAKRFNKEKELKDKVDAAYEKGRQEAAEQMAVKGFEEMKNTTRKRKKTDEEFKKERKDLVASIKEKWNKAGKGKLYAVPLPGVDKLEKFAAIAPDVAILAKNYIDNGVVKLEEVIRKIHADIKDEVPDLRERDIRDIISGMYNERKETRNEIAEKYRNLQREAELLNQIEKERVGYEKTKSEGDKIKKTARIKELETRLKKVQQLKEKEISEEGVKDVAEMTADDLGKLKDRRLKEITNLREKLKNKDYSEPLPPPKRITLDKESQRLEDEYLKMKEEDLYQQEKAKYDRMGKATKAWDWVWKVAGLRRVIQTAIDFSIPFRQNVTTTLNPLKWMPRWENGELKTPTNIRQFKNMFQQTFSPKHMNEYIKRLKDTGEYYEMKEDGIVFSMPSEIELSKREEDFRNNLFQDLRKLRDKDNKAAKLVSYIAEPILASERSAAGALNTVRVERYRFAKKALEAQGMTRQNSPEAYKKMGEWIMNMTGRGKMAEFIEQSRGASRLAGNTFYGAKLMASRINLLKNPFLSKMPKEVRMETFKDMVGFTSGIVLTGLALMAKGGQVSFNPDDSDFLQVKFGDTKYDISGGMSAYIRTFLRLSKTAFKEGEALVSGSKKDKKAADKYGSFAGRTGLSFLTNKFAPNTSYAYHFITGKSPGSEDGEFDPYEFLEYYPMYVDDIKDAWKQEGVSAFLTIGAPGLFGIGTQTYPDKKK